MSGPTPGRPDGVIHGPESDETANTGVMWQAETAFLFNQDRDWLSVQNSPARLAFHGRKCHRETRVAGAALCIRRISPGRLLLRSRLAGRRSPRAMEDIMDSQEPNLPVKGKKRRRIGRAAGRHSYHGRRSSRLWRRSRRYKGCSIAETWSNIGAVVLLLTPWPVYWYKWRKNAEEFETPTDEAIRQEWELNYLFHSRKSRGTTCQRDRR
jgi:hypothetical protein